VIQNAGQLKTRIKLQKPQAAAASAYGEVTPTWVDVGSVWSEVNPQLGREYDLSGKEHEEHTLRVRIRYNSDVRASWRVVIGSRTLEILSAVNTAEANEELILLCKEIVE